MTTVKIPAGSIELSGELVLPPAEDQDHALRFDIDLLTQRLLAAMLWTQNNVALIASMLIFAVQF